MIPFPEGIELYDIVVAPTHMTTLKIQLLGEAPGVVGMDEELPASFPEPEVIAISAMHGPWGWSEELRILVVFGGAPVPLFEDTWISDKQIAYESAIGNKLLIEQRRQEMHDWRDGLDLGDYDG